ncbi:MAG: MBOAT family protein [Candidatus Hydrogenedentes bacterium]|nr:MBOAT family protein [Candidatus Hydrogenedentota bacterium]
MLFNSMHFCVYFPIVVGLYFLIPKSTRWAWLLAASYYFYMAWEPGYVLLLWLSTLLDFTAALQIGKARSPRARNTWLAATLGSNLGMLFFFKYYNFFSDSLGAFSERVGFAIDLPHSEFLLPIGISFYTFQTMSYTIDVYRGVIPPERHLGRFALYICFFPQLVAGPIERAKDLLPQMKLERDFDYTRATDGLRLMAWGFFKKMVIADRLAMVVEHVYRDPENHGGPALAIATLCFAYQIYCDFSGYSDIAVGAARVLGVRLSTNFNRPYAAASIAEFWRRWHISLSTWFRDYVYLPLGGNRVSSRRWAVNIIAVFAISGLWHGAHWKFLLWGLIHGAALLLEHALARRFPATTRLPRAVKVAMTFAIANFAWIFFRADSLADAWLVIANLPRGWGVLLAPEFWNRSIKTLGLPPGALLFALVAMIVCELVQHAQARAPLQPWFRARPVALRWAVYTAIFWTLFLGGIFRQTEFIYFEF